MPNPTSTISTLTTTNVNSDGQTPYIADLNAGIKWGVGVSSGVTITYSVPSAGATWKSGYAETSTFTPLPSDQVLMFKRAMQTWADVANINFVEVPDNATSSGDIRIGYSQSVPSVNSAYAYLPSTNSTGGDIWVRPNGNFLGLEGALVHEIGHALGLIHPKGQSNEPSYDNSLSIMSYNRWQNSLYRDVITTSNSVSWSYQNVFSNAPAVADIAAIQYLYGANTTFANGNNTYTFDPASPFLKTIWDSGGSDTISVSNFSTNCVISLVAGTFSSIVIPSDSLPAGYTETNPGIYEGMNNLGIALGVIIENATGGSGNDQLTGNSSANTLDGGTGSDSIIAGDGDDIIIVQLDGNDVVDGGNGNDSLVVRIGAAVSTGSFTWSGKGETNNDLGTFDATASFAALSNLLTSAQSLKVSFTSSNASQNASVTSSSIENISLEANASASNADLIIARGTGQYNGQGGSDTFYANWTGSSAAKVWVNAPNSASVIDVLGTSVANLERLLVSGSDGADTLINWVANTDDDIRGGLGNDIIATGSGNDNLEGGSGDDILHGEQGNDTIKGDAGSDSLYGWSGTDSLDGGDGTDKLYGGSENDTLNGGNGADELNGDDGQDLLRGGSGGDRIYGWNDSDTLYGDAGDDFLFGGAAVDVLSGGDGADQLNGDDGNDTLTGDAGNDSLYGWNDNDSMSGGDGNDILSGWSGDDILNGDAANDELSGNDGADTLTGGDGDDVMYGGLNSDTYNFAGNFGFDGVEDYDYVAGSTDVFNFQSLDSSQLWFTKYGNDLRITAIGTGNAVTINRWYENSVFQIEQIKTNDNKTLLASKVDNLVNAMAGLNPPLFGQTTLNQGQQAVLQPILAANWA
jgi:Ca2+-binding RTX toxin-like protein